MQLYKLDFPGGKSYIGITSACAEDRFEKHVRQAETAKSQYAVHRAIRKYGKSNVSVNTMVIAGDWEYLCDLEMKAIEKYNTKQPHGYNMTAGGEGVIGRSVTESERDNSSQWMKMYWQEEEFRENQRQKRISVFQNRPELKEQSGERMKSLWACGSIQARRAEKRHRSLFDGTWKNPLTTDDDLVWEIYKAKSSGLTQNEVSVITGIGQQTISRIWSLKSPKGPLFRLGLVNEHGEPVHNLT